MWPDLICSVVSTGPKPSGQKIAPLKEKDGWNCGMGGGYQHIPNCIFTRKSGGVSSFEEMIILELVHWKERGRYSLCLFFESCTSCGKHHHQTRCSSVKLKFDRRNNDETYWKVTVDFNVYVWSLKMYRSSSLKSEHVWKVPNTACFKDRLHLQYLSSFFWGDWTHYDGKSHLEFVFACLYLSKHLKQI